MSSTGGGVDDNFKEVQDAFKKCGSEFEAQIKEELDRIGGIMQNNASNDAPVDTGYLASHIEKQDTGALSVTVTATAEYSGYVDQGTWKMEANPFFTRNVEAIQSNEIPQIEKNLGVKIESILEIVRA